MIRISFLIFIALPAIGQQASVGARALLYAATDAPPGSYTGPQRLRETRGAIGPARMSDLAADARLAYKLWGVSEDLTGFRYAWPTAAAAVRPAAAS